ncbi:acetamidase/formamidase family protein [Anoxynatronum buryatiense]|uniref:Amidase n=1 Tax=Anoxynatronum buryatiense TaxID=489973 RepID=A0AA45WVQ0_9CLOT|nr:acetamidase/formamidase family protein [Anoxynatronum buryatiense]SMP54337.1 amidase [Anoxynatronum buryatiense]
MNIIQNHQLVYAMTAANIPALRADSGSKVIFETCDCFQNQITSEAQSVDTLNWDHINPATGPLYVIDAQPGDVLKVDILAIDIDSFGVMAAIPGAGLLGDQVTDSQIKVMPIENGMARFSDKLSLPVVPTIGVIGVAPANGSIPCGAPGPHGGNMDNGKTTAGTTLFLPVFVEGALLAMGDLHGLIGDGEIMVSGLEVAGRVTVRVTVLKDRQLAHPMLETDTHLYTVASHENLLAAVKTATENMHQWVMAHSDLSFNEAGMLLSAAGNAEICQVVDPLLTSRFGMAKSVLEKLARV